jgi:sigma-B regulation protein RsbU (phosphoserine phosphatase)
MPTANEAAQAPAHRMECMEIWGGNRPFRNALSVPGIDAWVLSSVFEGDEHGGDVFYVSLCGGGKIARFMVADVAGHGRSVGDTGHELHKLMRKHINTLDQRRFARSLNIEFAGGSQDPGVFATALLTSYFAPTDHLVICNAGHPKPLWYAAGSGQWRWLDAEMPERSGQVANLPLGIVQPTRYEQFGVKLGIGDLVVIYSDSLIEAKAPHGGHLGEDGLLHLVASLDATDPQAFVDALPRGVDAFRGGKPPEDDQTIIVLHHNGADPPKQSIGEKLTVIGRMLGIGGH